MISEFNKSEFRNNCIKWNWIIIFVSYNIVPQSSLHMNEENS